jgi:hypothetical protein
MEAARKAQQPASAQGYILRMRGLPFSATDADIKTFFEPLKPIQDGIVIVQVGTP